MSTLQSFLANRHTENTQKLFSQIVNKRQHCPHCLLPTAREQSVTGRLRSANKLPRIFVKTNGFKNAFISYSLNSLQCEWCFSYSSDCVMQPSSCHITINWLIDWLIDWLSFSKNNSCHFSRNSSKLCPISEILRATISFISKLRCRKISVFSSF